MLDYDSPPSAKPKIGDTSKTKRKLYYLTRMMKLITKTTKNTSFSVTFLVLSMDRTQESIGLSVFKTDMEYTMKEE